MTKKRFIGTWKLLAYEIKNPNGKLSYPMGHKPVGYIMYNDDGYMSVAIMRADRPKFAADDWFGGTVAEKAQAFADMAAYCGKYEVYEDQNKVIHYPEVMSIPNQINVPQERNFEFKANELILSATGSMVDGEEHSSQLIWERV